MNRPDAGDPPPWAIPALALAAALIVAASLRRGMPISFDGWVYWQGSVSLLEGSGFRRFDGQPIRDWPPLYPAYLATVQALLGVSGRALVLSTALVTGVAVLAWGALIGWYARRRGDSSRVLLAVAWVAVLLALNARDLRAENLARALLPLLVWAALRGGTAREPRALLASAAIAAVALAALLATRNVAVAFVPAVALCFALARAGGPPVRALAAGVATLLPLAAWLVLRGVLEQGASHEVGLGAGQEGPFTYLYQLVRGVDRSTNLDFVGLPLLIVLAAGMLRGDRAAPDGGRREGALLLLFVGITLLATIGVFSVTWVGDRLRGRFTVWVPLVVGALGIVDSRRILTRRLAIVFFVVLFAQPTLRNAKHAIRGRGAAEPDYGTSALREFVPAAATIRPEHVRLPPRAAGGRVWVSPAFPRSLEAPVSRRPGGSRG